jgi:hypothetical protein
MNAKSSTSRDIDRRTPVKPFLLMRVMLMVALSSISALAMAQADSAAVPTPGSTLTSPPAMMTPPATVTVPPENLPLESTTGMLVDDPHQRALVSCEAKAVADREVCRERIDARFNSGRSIPGG